MVSCLATDANRSRNSILYWISAHLQRRRVCKFGIEEFDDGNLVFWAEPAPRLTVSLFLAVDALAEEYSIFCLANRNLSNDIAVMIKQSEVKTRKRELTVAHSDSSRELQSNWLPLQ
ncbi:hypothetical protein [Halovenus salina]|uniref:Uncharacterized protein n=1 Tax=Halovenus salina TaxID=1510225 RepID=A0ABD5W433_9EURY